MSLGQGHSPGLAVTEDGPLGEVWGWDLLSPGRVEAPLGVILYSRVTGEGPEEALGSRSHHLGEEVLGVRGSVRRREAPCPASWERPTWGPQPGGEGRTPFCGRRGPWDNSPVPRKGRQASPPPAKEAGGFVLAPDSRRPSRGPVAQRHSAGLGSGHWGLGRATACGGQDQPRALLLCPRCQTRPQLSPVSTRACFERLRSYRVCGSVW